jgi:opacity protein-like surface antigen
MKTILSGAAVGLALLAAPGAAHAQSPVDVSSIIPISVEARGGAAVPTGSFADIANNAFSFGASLHVQVAPQVSLYGGYSYADFDMEDTDVEGTDSGWEAGTRIAFPGVGFSPWVRAGLLFHDFELEVAGVEFDGDDEIGFELGAGAAFPLGPRVAISPGVAYRRYSTDFPGREENISYLNVDVGLRIRL